MVMGTPSSRPAFPSAYARSEALACSLTADAAREQAKASERAYAEGKAGRLEGVPITIKDLIPVKGVRTTFGSKLFEDYVPEADAVLVERIKEAVSYTHLT